MNDFDRELERDAALRVLAPMREGPLAVAGRLEEEAALKARVLRALDDQVQGVPSRVRARKQRTIMIGAAASSALAAAAAAAIAWLPGVGLDLTTASRENLAVQDGSRAQAQSAVRVEAIESEQGAEHAAASWIDELGQTHALAVGAHGAPLPAGTLELRSNDTKPRLRTAQGVEMKLSPQARLRVKSVRACEGPELRLLAGEVACAVPKLGAS